eukprot:m.78021 g.78021  ORF g.78021 m.78021 type:complete len:306 (-) comp14569_c1_seq2:52-969(-)
MQSEDSCVLATGGYDNTVRLWHADKGTCARTFQHADSQVNCLEIMPDKRTVAAAGHGQIRFYEVHGRNSSPVAVYDGHAGNVVALGFSENGSWMYSGAEDETVKIWDVRASPDKQRDYRHTSPVTCVALHPNQSELVSGDEEGRIVRWDLNANRCFEHLIPEPDTAVRSISISPNGLLMAAVNNEGNCFIWELSDGEFKALKKLVVHPHAYVLTCKFSPDGRSLVTTSSDRSAHVYDVTCDFQQRFELHGHEMWVWDAAFSADSAFLITASSDKTARVWDLQEGEFVLELKGHQRACTSVALNDT